MDTFDSILAASAAQASTVLTLLLTYIYCSLALVLLRILYKILTETLNECRKLKPSSSQAILITGATSGIGLSLCKYFHRLGYSVIVAYYSDQELGYAELVELNKNSNGLNSFYFVSLDVRSEESIANSYRIVSKLLAENGLQLYTLVNNAGVAQFNKGQWETRRSIRAIIEINLLGAMLMVRQYFPLLAETSNSRIVNVGSFISLIPLPLSGVYGASKSGLAYYTNSLSIDTDQLNVKAVTVHPGNLMWNTQILTDIKSSLGEIMDELSAEERKLYEKEFQAHRNRVEEVECEFMSLRELDAAERSAKRGNCITRLPQTLLDGIIGAIDPGVKLEDSPVMISFDNAVRLRNPPGEMFAGGWFFRIVVCAWLECMSYWFRCGAAVLLSRIALRRDQSRRENC